LIVDKDQFGSFCFANQFCLIANQFETLSKNANHFEKSIFIAASCQPACRDR